MADNNDNIVRPFSVVEKDEGPQVPAFEYSTYEFDIINPLDGGIMPQKETAEGILVVTDEWIAVVKANNQAQFAIPLCHVFKVKRVETKPADASVN